MSKPKTLLQHGKPKKRKEQALDTVDDFQAAGVDFEEAAGKWRAGDAAKSLRMFGRAVEVYSRGLVKFPQSLDLAYNKARVQLEIATHPVLVSVLQVPVLTVLEEALVSHRYALGLDSDNPDTLFNTSQVLTAIAEEYAKDANRPDQAALQLLEEALELQNRCLSVQELKFEENAEQERAMMEQTPSNDVENDEEPSEQGDTRAAEDQWFSVVEPITRDTLIDTALAQLGTLTTLCSILSSVTTSAPSSTLAWIEEYSSKLLTAKLPAYATDADGERLQEIALTKANFVSALLDAGFRLGKIDAETYKRERDNVFDAPELVLERTATSLMANVQSLMSFSSALGDAPGDAPPASYASLRWNVLSAAITNLSTAAGTQDILPEDMAKTHLLRGDCSLLQCQLGLPPISFQTAVANKSQLFTNAAVFYRNASKLSQHDAEKAIALGRSTVAEAIRIGKDPAAAANIVAAGRLQHEQSAEWVKTLLSDMVDEGLISVEQVMQTTSH